MRRYLVVANRTLGGHGLLDRVQQARAVGPCRFHIVVPASSDEQEPARGRLRAELARLQDAGATVDGAVVDADPFDGWWRSCRPLTTTR